MDIVKLAAVFALIVAALWRKWKLWKAMTLAIVATMVLWQIPVSTDAKLLWRACSDWENIQVLLVFYLIMFLQRMLERRSQLKLAQRDLNGIFNNRRVNATVAPICIGLLPSAAAAKICGDIVSEAAGDDLTVPEKAFVTSFFRHIPESFLPTYTAIILCSTLSGVPLGSFVLGMLPLIVCMFLTGYFYVVRRLPRETGDVPSENRGRDVLRLIGHLWSLFAIVLLVMAVHMPVWAAVLLVIAAAFLVYRFKPADLPGLFVSSFEPDLLLNTALALVFKEFISHVDVIAKLPQAFGHLPIPMWLIFALIFFFGSVICGSTAIIVVCTGLAFSAVPGGGMPLMVLLNTFSYLAMQVSPTHVCLSVVADHFHVSLGTLIRKTIPPVLILAVVTVGYYLLLRLICMGA